MNNIQEAARYITEIRRCSRCILPENFPDIEFDEKGVCNKCYEAGRKYLHKDYKMLKKELEKIFEWARRQGKKYDCIVPFSGGKDSAYTLYVCRKKYGLNVLTVNFNNGLRTISAIRNIEKIIKKLDVGYVCYGPRWEVMKKLYREFFLKTGHFCIPCDMGIWATVHRVAEEYDVPLIVSGFSLQIEARGKEIYSYNNNLFRTIAKDILTKDEMEDFLEETKIKKLLRRIKHLTIRRYRRQISLPDYIEWNDMEIKKTIEEELGWEKREDGSSDHIDCLFAPVKNYLMIQKWGFGEKTTKYASMVRAGQITREEALRRIQQEEKKEEPSVLEEFMNILEVKKEDIEKAKEKTHLIYL